MLEEEAGEYVATAIVLAEEIQASYYEASVHAEVCNTLDGYSVPEPQQQVSEPDDRTNVLHAEEPVDSFSNATNVVRDLPLEESVGEGPKQTYASILRLTIGQLDISMPHTAPLHKATLVTSDAALVTPPQTYPSLSTRPEKSSLDATIDVTTTTVEDEGDSKSVYVGNLPSYVSAFDLEYDFKNFGRIILDGVTVQGCSTCCSRSKDEF